MHNWKDFKKSINSLIDCQSNAVEVVKKWNLIKKQYNNYVPNHLISFFKVLDDNGNKSNVNILDHGCGGGTTLFLLAAHGYKNIWGLELTDSKKFNKLIKNINKILQTVLKVEEKKIQLYDGKNIPFNKEKFDIIFSQQVIEHVNPNLLNYFLSEEKRILKKGGLAFHQIPHRLGPFEGHTNKWFIHWLPKAIYHYLLKNNKDDLYLVKNHLFLKWPWTIKKKFFEYFLNVTNITFHRLRYGVDSEEFTWKEKLIRKFLVLIFKIPIIGNIFSRFLAIFFQLEILAKK